MKSKNKWWSGFFWWPKDRGNKAPLTPRQAIIMNLVVLIGGLGLVLVLHFLYSFDLQNTLLWYGIAVYVCFSITWSGLDQRTFRKIMHAETLFTSMAVCVIILAAIFGKDYEPFSTWGIVCLIVIGVIWSIYTGNYAVTNILRWRRGEWTSQGFSDIDFFNLHSKRVSSGNIYSHINSENCEDNDS